ncbi:sensor histidine kinase, partial [Stutzerimonas stutzeri]
MTALLAPRRPRWRNLALLALLLAPLLWPLQQLAERYYRNELTEQNRQTLDLYVANLLGTLNRYEVLPRILGDLPALRAVLQQDSPQVRDNANRLLKRLRNQTGADVIYLMATDGNTLAASNWDEEDSFVDRNFAFRPYFRQAMEGRLGRFFGLGTTSGKRGYYFGAAVRDGDQVLGVLVVKVDLDHTETLWGSTPEQLLVTDNFGVVILTSRPEWRFRATRGLGVDEREQIAFDQPYPTLYPQDLTLNIDAWLIQSRELKETGWTVRILAPVSLVERPVRTVVAIGAATLLALLLWLGLLMQRRRHFLERLA